MTLSKIYKKFVEISSFFYSLTIMSYIYLYRWLIWDEIEICIQYGLN